jgi:hypothetical protein
MNLIGLKSAALLGLFCTAHTALMPSATCMATQASGSPSTAPTPPAEKSPAEAPAATPPAEPSNEETTPSAPAPAGTSPAKRDTLLSKVTKGRGALQSWRQGYVRTKVGECYFAADAVGRAKALVQPEGSAGRRELLAYSGGSSVTGPLPYRDQRGEWPFVIWATQDLGGKWMPTKLSFSIELPKQLSGKQQAPRSMVLRRSDINERDGESISTISGRANYAVFALGDETRGQLDPKQAYFFELAGESVISTESQGIVRSATVPLYLGKPLAQATPTAEELAAHVKRTGELLIRYSLKTDVTQPTRVVTASGPSFTTRKTVNDGPEIVKFVWTRETQAIEFAP